MASKTFAGSWLGKLAKGVWLTSGLVSWGVGSLAYYVENGGFQSVFSWGSFVVMSRAAFVGWLWFDSWGLRVLALSAMVWLAIKLLVVFFRML